MQDVLTNEQLQRLEKAAVQRRKHSLERAGGEKFDHGIVLSG